MQIARPVAQDGNDPAGIKAGIAEERGEHGVKAEKEYELEVKSYLLMAEENEEVAFFNEPQSTILGDLCASGACGLSQTALP
jgi:hypothetical protein